MVRVIRKDGKYDYVLKSVAGRLLAEGKIIAIIKE